MDEKEIQKKIKQGAILAQVSFEVLGSPKEHVEKAIRGFVNNVKADSQITVLNEEFGEPEETEGKLWGVYADTEMLVNNLDRFIWLCVNFMPASIEIIAPQELRFKEKDFTNWLNDLLAKLHEISHTVRQTNANNELLVKSMNALIQNAIMLAAEHYHKPKEISAKLGIPEKQLEPFFVALVKNGKLEKKGNAYYKKGVKKSGAKKTG
ncbi:hypothetical protein AYK26_01975 [Euryarchaeota archaeon SM23-78]|nr:MAG: hypothetical protein AYK26_01975 [Euryarchaeota archaeon SM23-78]MBW3000313.1 hypothetical protein [Candidatus Woesearchaeota archaeon]